MATPIVLIEIENGMIQVYADKNILVATHDYDTEGNDLGRIDRENNEAAFQELTKKLELVNSADANKALAVLESPAPTDWGKEFAKNQDLRGKAMQYIAQMVDKHGSIKLPDPLWLAEDDKHTQWGEYSEAFICLDMDGLYITEPDDTDKDMMLAYLEDSIVIEIAAMVQKAIAGGTGK